jgi:prepilin-type N-terminal cleavage/methylation domain-containing protein
LITTARLRVEIQTTTRGFSLVEIAIALVVIGLLIGGILKGRELIDNAKVNMTGAQLVGLEAAGRAFISNYYSIPGDMSNPSLRLPNCDAAPCSTSGNEDRGLDTA